jgi:hypothetical protein
MSHKKKILKWLEQGKGITPLDALKEFKCLRLGARIYDLRKDGYDIETKMIEDDNDEKTYACYFLKRSEQMSLHF